MEIFMNRYLNELDDYYDDLREMEILGIDSFDEYYKYLEERNGQLIFNPLAMYDKEDLNLLLDIAYASHDYKYVKFIKKEIDRRN